MKRVSFLLILLTLLCVIHVDAGSVHRDVYYHEYYDANGAFVRRSKEVQGVSEARAKYLSEYGVIHITDADGDTHTLWVGGTYYDKDEVGTGY